MVLCPKNPQLQKSKASRHKAVILKIRGKLYSTQQKYKYYL